MVSSKVVLLCAVVFRRLQNSLLNIVFCVTQIRFFYLLWCLKMSEQQYCISDGEEDPEECQIDDPINCTNNADIRKNLFDEFDVPAKEKTSSESSSSGREYMKVYLRVRPFSSEEIEANENQNCVVKESPSAVLLHAPKESFAFKNSTRAGGEISHRFSFSNVFGEETTQKKFFDESTLPLVADFIHGQNCLVFTYGVTNSGKVFKQLDI